MALRIRLRIGNASGPYFASRVSSRIISAVICFTWVLSVSYDPLAEAINKPSSNPPIVTIKLAPSRTTSTVSLLR